MNLEDWLRNGWLVGHKPTRREIHDLLGIAERDLRECRTEGLSPDWRLAIAYNAALQSATAALAAVGYRSSRNGQHYRIFQSLALTVGADTSVIVRLDAFLKKRNISDYERSGSVSEKEARELYELARSLKRTVELWLKKNHPALYGK